MQDIQKKLPIKQALTFSLEQCFSHYFYLASFYFVWIMVVAIGAFLSLCTITLSSLGTLFIGGAFFGWLWIFIQGSYIAEKAYKKEALDKIFYPTTFYMLIKIFLAIFIYNFFMQIGCIFFVFPGMYFATVGLFIKQFVVFDNLSPIDAWKASIALTKGYRWQLFLAFITETFMYSVLAISIIGLPIISFFSTFFYTYLFFKMREFKDNLNDVVKV